VDAVGDVAGLVPLDETDPLAQARHEVVPLEREEIRVVAGLGEDALDDHVVGHGRAHLCLRRGVVTQALHRSGQLLVEDRAVAGRVETVQVAARLADLVEEAPEQLHVLPLLPEKGREEELLLEPPLLRDHHDQRQEVDGHALLTRLEERRDLEDRLLLVLVQLQPVGAILREVERLRIPHAEPLRLLVQAHRQRVVAEAVRARGSEGRPGQSRSQAAICARCSRA
jgi:hypothetical protein